MRIFILSEFLPKPDIASGDRRLAALLNILATDHEVDLCLLRDESRPETLPAWEGGSATDRAALESIAAQIETYRKPLEHAGVRIVPFGWKHVGAALARRKYDVGIFEYYWITEVYSPVFRRCQPGAHVICDSVDVCHARNKRGMAFGQEKPEDVALAEKRELAAFRMSDAVVTVSSDDDALVRALPGMPPTFVIPNIVPVRPRAARPASKECLFVGGFKHYPNVDGLLWFAQNVWGRVHAAVPDAILTVVGSNPPAEITRLADDVPGVHVVGYVPDTNPYLDRCAVSVAPLRWGGGMKGKVTEAVACGVPVVTTPIGAQGFDATDGVEMVITDDPAIYADALIALLNDPQKAEAMGLAGQAKLSRLCNPEAVAEQTETMLRDVVGSSRFSERFSAQWLAYRTGYHAVRTLLGKTAGVGVP